MSDKQPSARAQLRTWIRAQIDGQSEVSLPDLTTSAVEWVSSKENRSLAQALLAEFLRPWVYEEALRVVSESRAEARTNPSTAPHQLIQLGDTIVSRSAVTRRAATLERYWLGFREHAGDRHVLLMDMTSADLALAEAERRKRADTDTEHADLWAKLRTRLENGQRVRDVWSAQEIEAARQAIRDARAA